jgi:hypothetical protein
MAVNSPEGLENVSATVVGSSGAPPVEPSFALALIRFVRNEGPLSRLRCDVRGKIIVLGRNCFARQAATLLKFAQSTSDPQLAAALIEKAADLKSQVDESPPAPPDQGPHAADVERQL